jgi:hypothetical protein
MIVVPDTGGKNNVGDRPLVSESYTSRISQQIPYEPRNFQIVRRL